MSISSIIIIFYACSLVCMHAQSCSTLCNPMDCCLPGSGSFAHGILQARILEWVATSSSRGPSNPRIKSASPALAADSSPLTCSSEITFIQYVRTLSMSQTPLFHLSISWVAPISPWCIGFCKFTFDIPLSLSRLSKP